MALYNVGNAPLVKHRIKTQWSHWSPSFGGNGALCAIADPKRPATRHAGVKGEERSVP